jgi:vancomycin resistance protein YoaR
MTATVFLGVVFCSLISLMSFLLYPNAYKGAVVEGVDLSGRSREEVAQLLTLWQKEYHDRTIMLQYEDRIFNVEASTIDLDIDVDAALDEVLNYGRHGSWWERIKQVRAGIEEGHPITLDIKYNADKLSRLTEQWKGMIERPPSNATFNLATGKIVPHEPGYRLESEVLEPLVLEAFKKAERGPITLPVQVLYPKITVDDITNSGIREILSTYTTIFNRQDVNRTENIKVAARKTNGYILYPGKVFSFNEVVGPREKVYGFKEALEIVDGEFVSGVGGGICQVSSTLYNAVILANLNIVERYNHSKPLSYIPLGRDATVSFGDLDFKFVNNTSGPLMIMAEVDDNKLMIGILGGQPLIEKIEIKTVNQETIFPNIVKKEDASLYIGETKIDKQGKPGYSVTTIRLVQSKGQGFKREVLSKDIYLADDTVIKVGTLIPPFVEKPNSKQ